MNRVLFLVISAAAASIAFACGDGSKGETKPDPTDTMSQPDVGPNTGSPCESNDSCTGGTICAVGPHGGVCLAACPPPCEPGYICQVSPKVDGESSAICTPMSWNICAPCTENNSCGGPDDFCIALDNNGTFCGFACETGDDCPSGTKCAEVNIFDGSDTVKHCVPSTMQCPCLPYHAGKRTVCKLDNDKGICPGERQCLADGQWGECVGSYATDETCNGIDDDCDGVVDDGFSDADWDGKANCVDDDDDNDSVIDDVDNCPSEKNSSQANSDDDPLGDACDPDDDNDGWPDYFDCGPQSAADYPGAAEVLGDGKDNNCNGVADEPPGSHVGECGLNCFEAEFGPGTQNGFEPDESNSEGVSLDEKGYLILGKGTLKFSNLWVSNSSENTVSRIDTQTGSEVGRYHVCYDPSRTAVDLDGNAWIACRGDGAVVKILVDQANCPDVDNDGKIETAIDANGDNKISLDEMHPKGEDECVKFIVSPGGTVQRAAGVDKDNYAWIGDWDTMKLRRLHPDTGAVVQTIDLPCNPYGLALDPDGIIWVSGRGCDKVIRVDPVTSETKSIAPTVPDYFSPYGISVDIKGRVWVADCCSTARVFRYSPAEDKWDYALLSPSPRGLAASADGFVYVALDGSDAVGVVNGDTMAVVDTIPLGGNRFPVGMSVDMDGFVWTVNQFSNTAIKIDPIEYDIVGEYPVGMGPYCYSDMTGFQLLNYMSPEGEYRFIVEAPEGTSPKWQFVDFDMAAPAGTSANVWIRTASTAGALGTVPYIGPFGPYPAEPTPLDLTGIANLEGRFLQVKIRMYINDDHQSPMMKSVKVIYTTP